MTNTNVTVEFTAEFLKVHVQTVGTRKSDVETEVIARADSGSRRQWITGYLHSDTTASHEKQASPTQRPALSHPSGQFVSYVFDPHRWSLTVMNDLSGSIPLFWSEDEGVFRLGSSLVDLVRLGVNPIVSPAFVQSYELLGFAPDHLTFLESVQSLAPGSTLRIVDGHPLPHDTLHPSARPSESFPEVLSDEISRLVSSSGSSTQVPPGYLLSGGIDSSLLALCSSGRGGKAFTFEGGGFGEGSRARAIANDAGLDYELVEPTFSYDLNERNELLLELSGYPCPVPAFAFNALQNKGVETIVCGHGPDEFSQGYLSNVEPKRRLCEYEQNKSRFPNDYPWIELHMDLVRRSAAGDPHSTRRLHESDVNYYLRQHSLFPTWLGAHYYGMAAFSPYVVGRVRSSAHEHEGTSGDFKSLVRASLLEKSPQAGRDVVSAPKVSMPDALAGPMSELAVWSYGVAVDPEVLSTASHWPIGSQLNLALWSETIRGFRRLAESL